MVTALCVVKHRDRQRQIERNTSRGAEPPEHAETEQTWSSTSTEGSRRRTASGSHHGGVKRAHELWYTVNINQRCHRRAYQIIRSSLASQLHNLWCKKQSAVALGWVVMPNLQLQSLKARSPVRWPVIQPVRHSEFVQRCVWYILCASDIVLCTVSSESAAKRHCR